jgi:hypothetical protein
MAVAKASAAVVVDFPLCRQHSKAILAACERNTAVCQASGVSPQGNRI